MLEPVQQGAINTERDGSTSHEEWLRELWLFSPKWKGGKKTQKDSNVCKSLVRRTKEDRVKLFPEVPRDWTRSNEHKPKHRKFYLSDREHFLLWGKLTGKDCPERLWSSILGDTPKLLELGPELPAAGGPGLSRGLYYTTSRSKIVSPWIRTLKCQV